VFLPLYQSCYPPRCCRQPPSPASERALPLSAVNGCSGPAPRGPAPARGGYGEKVGSHACAGKPLPVPFCARPAGRRLPRGILGRVVTTPARGGTPTMHLAGAAGPLRPESQSRDLGAGPELPLGWGSRRGRGSARGCGGGASPQVAGRRGRGLRVGGRFTFAGGGRGGGWSYSSRSERRAASRVSVLMKWRRAPGRGSLPRGWWRLHQGERRWRPGACIAVPSAASVGWGLRGRPFPRPGGCWGAPRNSVCNSNNAIGRVLVRPLPLLVPPSFLGILIGADLSSPGVL